MHDYSVDRHPKEKVLFVLALLAITSAPVLQELAEQLVAYLGVAAGWSSAPAIAVPVFSLFIGLYFVFDKYLWKIGWLRRLLLVPDLNGTWKCTGQTTLKDSKPADIAWEARIVITQSWSRILIHLSTAQSESKSISASIFHEEGVGYRLLYQYNNRPNADEIDLRNHSGSSELLFSEDAMSATGSYYTDRHRTTVGTMSLVKEVD